MVDLKTLSDEVKSIVGKNLVSMIVFGSHARGDNNEHSDVDLIVVVKKKTKKIIKKLLRLESKTVNGNNWFELQVLKFLNAIGFKKNIFLFTEDEFINKKFNFCGSKLLSWLMIPKGLIWNAIKRDGKIVYGKDLLINLIPRISFWDKIKAPMPGIGACAIATLMLPFSRDKAVMLAQTGLRWTYMNVMGVLYRSDIMSVFGNFVEIMKIAFKGNYV